MTAHLHRCIFPLTYAGHGRVSLPHVKYDLVGGLTMKQVVTVVRISMRPTFKSVSRRDLRRKYRKHE